jgi:hypothetical protein
MSEPRSKRVVVKTDKAASNLAGRPVAVARAAKTPFGRKHARSISTEVLTEAVRGTAKVPTVAAGAVSKKPKQTKAGAKKLSKKPVRSDKKHAKKGRQEAKEASGRWVQKRQQLQCVPTVVVLEECLAHQICATLLRNYRCTQLASCVEGGSSACQWQQAVS